MPTSATGRSRTEPHKPGSPSNAGFTLLELLVVVTIIAIFLGVAVLSIGLASDNRDLQQELFRLKSVLDLVREEALMQNRDFGVLFSATGYRFYVYDYEQLAWVEPLADNLLTERPLRGPVDVELTVEGRKIVLDRAFEPEALSDPMPQIMILSTGEITPFEAALVRPFDAARVELTAEIDGTIEIQDRETAL